MGGAMTVEFARELIRRRTLSATEDASLGSRLAAAAWAGRTDELVDLLAQEGSDENERFDALAVAAKYGQSRGVAVLMRHLDLRDPRAEPALVAAAESGHKEIVRQLHESGAVSEQMSRELRGELQEMMSCMESADPIYRPSKFWSSFGRTNRQMLEWSGEKGFKRTVNQSYYNLVPSSVFRPCVRNLPRLWLRTGLSRFGAYRMTNPDEDGRFWFAKLPYYQLFGNSRWRRFVYRMMVASMCEYVRRTGYGPLFEMLEEPSVGAPIEIVDESKRPVSQDLAHSVFEAGVILDEGRRRCGQARLRLAELGAGYGRLAYVLLSRTSHQYFIFDIPPALGIAQWYARQLFPHKRIFPFRPFREFAAIEEELANADIAFFLPHQLEFVPERYFDGFSAISVLHEMQREQIVNYLFQMGRTSREFLYLKNYRHYWNPLDGLTIGRDDYAPPPGWRTASMRSYVLDPEFEETVLEPDDAPASVAKALRRRSTFDTGRRASVSVLLANYNHAEFLPPALEAIFQQTRPADEVIVIDDASTDGSVDILRDFESRHESMRLIRSETNRGPVRAINEALRQATGDYVVWAASDDRIRPEFLDRNLSMLEAHPGAAVAFSKLATFERDPSRWAVHDAVKHSPAFDLGTVPEYYSPEALRRRLDQHYLWLSSNTAVTRREALLELGGFWPPLRWHADWFSIQAVALRYGCCVIPEVLALLRVSPGGYSSRGLAARRAQAGVLRAVRRALANPGFSDIRNAVRARPSVLSPLGTPLLRQCCSSVRDFDLGWRFLTWALWRRAYLGGAVSPLGRVRQEAYRLAWKLACRVSPDAWMRDELSAVEDNATSAGAE